MDLLDDDRLVHIVYDIWTPHVLAKQLCTGNPPVEWWKLHRPDGEKPTIATCIACVARHGD